MDTTYEELLAELDKYHGMMSVVMESLANETSEEKRGQLLSARDSFAQLLSLTMEQMNYAKLSSSETVQSTPVAESNKQGIYFQETAAPAVTENEMHFEETASPAPAEIQAEETRGILSALEGRKCQAPYGDPSDESNYHNAIIAKVETLDADSLDTAKVRVFFTNPVCKDMVPCKKYLTSSCKYSAATCWFSHGRIVTVTDLQHYRHPDFTAAVPGAKALVKRSNNVWSSATILAVDSDELCSVKFEADGYEATVKLENVLPSETSEGKEECFVFNMGKPSGDEYLLQNSLPDPPAAGFGEWEKHTKGIGSRLMAQMGYIPGTGLGKHGEGRVEPVKAVILPLGKSLDHWMRLKEGASDEYLFGFNRKLKKHEKKEAKQIAKKNYESKGRNDVFNFLNEHLSGDPDSSSTRKRTLQMSPIPGPSSLKKQSSRSLNVTSLQIGESIHKAEKSLSHLHKSLSRHSAGSVTHKKLLQKIEEEKKEIKSLKASELVVNNERNQRNEYKKMTCF